MSNARLYQKQFKELVQAVFQKKAYFGDFSAGGLEALDGVSETATAFSVKTTDIPVVIGNYNTGANVAFGTGTSNSSRFGNRTEIIYSSQDVPYTNRWAIHEGIDRFTVNLGLEAAVADRLELQAQAKTKMFDDAIGAVISAQAGHAEELTTVAVAPVEALFNKIAKYYVNLEVVGEVVAKVNMDIYNLLVDSNKTVLEKRSDVNIGENTVRMYKGFLIEAVPDAKFQTGEYAYFYPKNVGKAFTGINTARTVESEDFDGVALQAAGKYGAWILPANKPAIVKVTAPAVGG